MQKSWSMTIACMAAGLAFFLGSLGTAHAGLINHKVHVTNGTSDKAVVYLYTANGHSEFINLAAGDTYTYATGLHCPSNLTGSIIKGVKYTDIISRCLGPGHVEGKNHSDCGFACKSSSWKIQKHENDGAYHFDEQ
ncbi:hypothetical protein FY034_03070 [Trichlorobacter lovleyi]|uniref:hypothetical protein n=1 Tax=Trichlorobacter lovleyi TaxID=313985 RepID=UPI00223ED0BE|nr:hypothetical protein [Trichlorobacter lovleyi]QOX77963.1 hypothetical protein FY034_03070 [Trichlorobacter lovleyi]